MTQATITQRCRVPLGKTALFICRRHIIMSCGRTANVHWATFVQVPVHSYMHDLQNQTYCISAKVTDWACPARPLEVMSLSVMS